MIYADLTGVDELSADLDADQSLRAINKLVRQFDAAAENSGIERVRQHPQRLSGQLRSNGAKAGQYPSHR